MNLLYELTGAACCGAGDVWLFRPMKDPEKLPKMDGAVVVNTHRSAVTT
jgi:hypothetical protein